MEVRFHEPKVWPDKLIERVTRHRELGEKEERSDRKTSWPFGAIFCRTEIFVIKG